MATTRQARQTGFLALAAATLLCLNGCSSTPTASTQSHDPLHGVLTPPALPQPNSAPKTPGTPTSYPHSGQQSYQPPGSELISTNTATLAGMSGSTLGRPLAIDDQGRTVPAGGQLTSGNWTSPNQQPQYPGYNPNPRVEKVPDAEPTIVKNSPTSSQSLWGSASPPATPTPVPTSTPTLAETLTKQLQDRGVINHKVDTLPTGVHLTCYAQANGKMRILEATAVDYATAAQAILQQLDVAR
jgi:hypothetical protein